MKLCILDANTLGQDIDLSIFDVFGEVSIYGMTKPTEVAERIQNQDIIIANKVVLNEENLSQAPTVKLISLTSTGVNNVDLDYTKKAGIAVTNVAGYSTDSVVQHTFAMAFYLLHHLSYYDHYVKSSTYVDNDSFTHLEKPFVELKGKTWGIIGMGAIGQSVATIAQVFGCRIVYFSTSGKNTDQPYENLPLSALLQQSDIISIHAPLTSQTQNLITYKELQQMKKSAILLNVGRGSIIHEPDLAQALDEELIAGAGLDVLASEPIQQDNPLLQIKNKERLLITPHIAWSSIEARMRLIHEVSSNIEAFLAGKERNRV